jgi:hypothetical protein
MQKCECESVERLDQGQGNDLRARAHHGPTQHPGCRAQRQSAWRAKTAHERRTDEKKHENLRANRLRPQQARGSGAYAGGMPSDHRECVMKGVTAQHQGGNQQEAAKGGYLQQDPHAASLLRIPGEAAHHSGMMPPTVPR